MSHLISETFDATNFQETAPVPKESIPVLMRLHEEILLPVIKQFGSLISTSGHRSDQANTAAHGQPNSEHLYTPQHCALDFYSPNAPARTIFDWIRMNPSLAFHQLILEHSANGPSVIHLSMNTEIPASVRSVLEGATHNSEKYAKVDHVDWAGPSNHDAVQDAATG